MTTAQSRQPGSPARSASRLGVAATDFVLVFGAVIGLALVFLRTTVLPTRFSLDGMRIQAIANDTGSSFGDRAFGNVAEVYKVLGLAGNGLAAGLAGYLVFVALIVIVRLRTRRFQDSWWIAILYFAALVYGGVYLGFYSKDAFVVIIAAFAVLLPTGFWSELVLLAGILVYADLFRSYWLVVAGLYLGFRIVRLGGWRLSRIIIVLLLAVAAASLALSFVLHMDPDHFRTAVNDDRVDDVVTGSAIQPYVSWPQPLGGTVNNMLTGIFLIVPLPLAWQGSAYYIANAAVLAVMWLIVGFGFTRWRRGGNELRPSRLTMRLAPLLGSFLVVQALFEPDYGSALRHATPFLVVAIALVADPISSGREPAAERPNASLSRAPSPVSARQPQSSANHA